jgi:hypothetical protein
MATLQELMELNTLNECAYECTKQSRWKETTQRYIADMLVRNLELQGEVLGGSYYVRPTTDFFLNERGHIRKIEAPVVRDRIVQKSLTVRVLTPSLRPYVIYDNYASLKLRGTHFARRRFEIMLRRYMSKNGTDGYVLLIDVKKYFESIDHEVLKNLIAPKIANEPADVVELIHYIIDHSSHTDKGLNLGSEAPQILAVYYLNPVDTFIKVVKGVKYYGRYMDDIFVIGESKAELKSLLSEIIAKLEDLRLNVNMKKTHIVKLTHGFTFLQVKYDILPSGKILKRPAHSKVVRERRRLRAFKRMLDIGRMTEAKIWNCYKSWRGSVVREHNACTKTLRSMDDLYASLFPVHVDEPFKGRYEMAEEAFMDAETRDLQKLVV